MNKSLLTNESQFWTNTLFAHIAYYRKNIGKWMFIRKKFKRISEITLEALINDEIGKILFEKYIGIEKSTSFPEILIKWRGYRLCKKIKENIYLLDEQETRDNLILWSPSLLWEDNVMKKIEEFEVERDTTKIKAYLGEMMGKFIIDMEISSFYLKFIYEIKYEQEKIKNKLGKIYDEKLKESVISTIL